MVIWSFTPMVIACVTPMALRFFSFADTFWDLFAKMGLEDADLYLEDRRKKGFTTVLYG
jgi:hypothetical protein